MTQHRSDLYRLPGAATALLLAASASTAVASGPYVGLEAGAGLQNTQNVVDDIQGAPASESGARFGTGFAGRLLTGYSFSNVFRPEVELGFQRKNGKSGGIDENAYTAMGSLWVDVIHQYGYFVDFGAGLGLADVALRHPGGHDDAVSGAWQLGGGAGLDLTSHLALAAEFRRLSTFDRASFKVSPDETLHTRFATNLALLELRYSFDGTTSDSIFDRISRWR